MNSYTLDFIRDHVFTLPLLAKFALAMVMLLAIPRLCRRVPAAVGLLLGGVIIGPYALGLASTDRPIADFFAELGKLLLMFFAGLDIDLALFRRARNRSITFGLTTTVLPLALGTAVGLAFGYAAIPAIVIGSLLASHTLSEIAGYVVLVLFGLGRIAADVLKRVEDEEDAYFVLMLCIMAIARALADAIQLPGIVGAFLAGLAVNASAREKLASAKLDFLARSLFIPIFFIVTGFLINPVSFVQGIIDNFPLVMRIIAALLVCKWIAAWVVGHAFGYSRDEQLAAWSLTLPQVAATLAATLVAHETLGPAGQRLLDDRMLNVVPVLVTAILGPVLTGRFAPRLATGTGHLEMTVR